MDKCLFRLVPGAIRNTTEVVYMYQELPQGDMYPIAVFHIDSFYKMDFENEDETIYELLNSGKSIRVGLLIKEILGD